MENFDLLEKDGDAVSRQPRSLHRSTADHLLTSDVAYLWRTGRPVGQRVGRIGNPRPTSPAPQACVLTTVHLTAWSLCFQTQMTRSLTLWGQEENLVSNAIYSYKLILNLPLVTKLWRAMIQVHKCMAKSNHDTYWYSVTLWLYGCRYKLLIWNICVRIRK